MGVELVAERDSAMS